MERRDGRQGENRRRGRTLCSWHGIALAQIVLARRPRRRVRCAVSSSYKRSKAPRAPRCEASSGTCRSLAQADRRGCFGSFFFRARGKGCGTLLGRIDRLEQMIHQPRPSRSNDWVRRELARNGCFKKAPVETAEVASSGGFRTVCVRSCDGYFFPLGFSQSKGDLTATVKYAKGCMAMPLPTFIFTRRMAGRTK